MGAGPLICTIFNESHFKWRHNFKLKVVFFKGCRTDFDVIKYIFFCFVLDWNSRWLLLSIVINLQNCISHHHISQTIFNKNMFAALALNSPRWPTHLMKQFPWQRFFHFRTSFFPLSNRKMQIFNMCGHWIAMINSAISLQLSCASSLFVGKFFFKSQYSFSRFLLDRSKLIENMPYFISNKNSRKSSILWHVCQVLRYFYSFISYFMHWNPICNSIHAFSPAQLFSWELKLHATGAIWQ